MRILYITPCWPHGPSFGGQLRALHIGRALRQLGEVTLSVVTADPPAPNAMEQIRNEFQFHSHVTVDTCLNRSFGARLRWWLDPRFMNVHGCVARAPERAALLAERNRHDLVWVMNSRTPNILQQWHWPRAVLDIDDIPSTFQRSVEQSAAGAPGRLKAGALRRVAQRRERHWHERFPAQVVCSQADRDYLGSGDNIFVVPNGFTRPDRTPSRVPVMPPRLGFIGLFSYMPNLEGVRWFVRECWPRLRHQVPGIELRLIGKETDGPLRPDGQGITGLGWVADPAEEIATWSGMIIPVRHGAGTRVKIAEAFSRRCPVVSTRLGAYGYDVQDGRELLLADDPVDFTSACRRLAEEPGLGKSLAERAWERFLHEWTWDSIAPRVSSAATHATTALS